jgi:hypothetical protein
MSTAIREWMATTQMRMRRKKKCEPMMDLCRMWKTGGIVGVPCEPVMSTEMMARMATLRMQMIRKMH